MDLDLQSTSDFILKHCVTNDMLYITYRAWMMNDYMRNVSELRYIFCCDSDDMCHSTQFVM